VGGHQVGFLMSSDCNVNDLRLTCSSSQKRIMEMQCDILIPYFKNPNTIALVKENIGRISDGSSSHSADALKLWFKKAIELKRQNCVRLRCSHGGCPLYTDLPAYSSIGTNTYCQGCIDRGWGYRFFQCASCGSCRSSSYTSCRDCGKKFI